MQITTSRNELASALTFAKDHLPKYPSVPVLAGIRVEVADGRLTLAAFDYETSARVHVTGDGAEPGVILVCGHELVTAAKSLPTGKSVRVTLTANSERLTMSADGVVSTFAAMPMEDYPALPEMPAALGTVAGQAFGRAVARVAAAAGTDETLPVLTCVEITAGQSELTFAATDRYRLASDTTPWTAASVDAPEAAFLVAAKVLAGYAKRAGDKVTVSYAPSDDGGMAGFSDGMRELVTRTDYGDFPKWRKLMPSSHGVEVRVPRAAFRGSSQARLEEHRAQHACPAHARTGRGAC